MNRYNLSQLIYLRNVAVDHQSYIYNLDNNEQNLKENDIACDSADRQISFCCVCLKKGTS